LLRLKTCSHTLPSPALDGVSFRAGEGSALLGAPTGFTGLGFPTVSVLRTGGRFDSSRELLKSIHS